MHNLCNCPNCQTNDCPAAAELEALQSKLWSAQKCYKEVEVENDQLRTQHRELREDKETLNWLEANIGNGPNYGISRAPNGWWMLYRDVTERCKPTLRELVKDFLAQTEVKHG